MQTLVYKPTLACNLGCRYCYIKPRSITSSKDRTKAVDTAVKLARMMVEAKSNRYNVILHGGEPLLVGLDTMREILEVFYSLDEKANKKIRLSVQTNLTLMTEEMIELLLSYDVRVSTSIDGTRAAHDHYRYSGGAGSWDKLQRQLEMCRKNGLRVNAVCVVNDKNYEKARSVYEYFNDCGIDYRVNYLTIEAKNRKWELDRSIQQYKRFLYETALCWLEDVNSNIEVQPISEMYISKYTGAISSCQFSNECQRYFVAVGPDGSIYPCGKVYGMKEYISGNIDTVNPFLAGEDRQKIYFRPDIVPEECVKCQHILQCRGLCPLDNSFEAKSVLTRSSWCTAFKLTWDMIEKHVSESRKIYEYPPN